MKSDPTSAVNLPKWVLEKFETHLEDACTKK